ncbi:MAG: hypothetical protein UX08_C0008G0010 [Candidatus Collierbacteria bacterium GW2011_GWB1_45_35]|uniref:7 transmembrane helices usually fused to an inactive transglutaminase domain-containing protein n=2 Tax=Candidatus Collieribacteriota TaxID=1752725 RepID=A0A837IFT4_9BACT|nr:MAG: hypothetical protein UW48_C0011G0010 [Microgenomates group bacterium GW2011_GWC1_44_23]KKT95062.1 MAG: hypothetical protein UW96_C0011G0008 [Candidatus Collierbacteria bacterium GW2011_GWA1_45_15]KKT99164.1 MAG: hypothetical protein UX01_C0012G0010 [Candidatus Collierbacteria bacterium GW2011_GWB2_45_17]KKU05283.1 MAG: hypothetical protein UX08_C0008G0010 [Candidatus Collierbacteria bacterium GW2011_GWB1_45_35]KKU07703.1 MAG: hypothetical protein UX11_C0011G0010 [Candidatus Collierbacte
MWGKIWDMKKIILGLALSLFLLSGLPALAVATRSAEVDLTVPYEAKDRLVSMLKSQKVSGWWVGNSLKLSIRRAVTDGVSPNTLMLLFLFPLVAGLVAFSRQVVGVSGFGMIIPALLSMAFLSTGGLVGLVLLTFILLAAVLGRVAIKKIKVPYLPKLAILIWLISMAVLGLLIMSPMIGLERLSSVGIFPIMIFVLLAETFIEAQITRNFSTSFGMTLETVVLAFVAYWVIGSPAIQTGVLLQPEISVIGILILDLLIGKYKGLRLSEIWRFRKILKK